MGLTRRAYLLFLGAGALTLAGCAGREEEPSPSSPAPRPPSPTPSPTPSPAPSPSPTGPVDPLPEGVVNALIYGTDARGDADFGGNTDAIVLAQISADRKRVTFVSIARDTLARVGGSQTKINAAYSIGGRDLFVKSVSDMFGGIPIHVTMHTNFAGFISITRYLKGIRVFNRNASTVTVNATGRFIEFGEGELFLENTDALIYARQRYGLEQGDLDRAERHRALLTGIIAGLQLVQEKTPRLMDALVKNLAQRCRVSGIDDADVPALVDPLMEVDRDRVTSLMLPLEGFSTINGQWVNLPNRKRLSELSEGLRNGDVSAYVDRYGTDYTPTRG